MTLLNSATSASPAQIVAITAHQLLPGWIRRRRRSLDLTQADLAGRLACSLSTIQKVEEGERRPSKNLASGLIDALEIPESERAVFMRLARGKPSPRQELAVHSSANAEVVPPPNNTPFPTNALVGREAEADWISTLLMGDDARLVTLTGLPGIGKTRLAQHVAHRVPFEAGVCYISLADLPPQADAASAGKAVAAAVGKSLSQLGVLEDGAILDSPAQVIAHLRELHLLLVLDNFEHVMPARDLLVQLLQETRWVKLLITSHERLRLNIEHVMQLTGLPIGEELPAVQLFVARASRIAGPGFAENSDPQKIMRICHLVDGMPLGIEMVSALTATYTLDEIGDVIERDLNTLRTTSPDVPVAHRNMHDLMGALWQRLCDDERCVVMSCAAFESSFSFIDMLNATHMTHITHTTHMQLSETRLRAVLTTLLDKSVFRRVGNEASPAPGQFLLHRLVRQFAQQVVA